MSALGASKAIVDAFHAIKDKYECFSCLETAMDPRKCMKCGNVACRRCVAEWSNGGKRDHCPNCRKRPLRYTKLSLVERNIYDEVTRGMKG